MKQFFSIGNRYFNGYKSNQVAKQKVLLINDFSKGGGAENVFLQTQKLLSEDYEIFTYTAFEKFTDTNKNIFSFIYSFRHAKNIKKIIEDKQIDIVHIHNFRWLSPSVLSVKKSLKRKVKFLVTAHDYFMVCPNVAYGYFSKGKFILVKPGQKISYFFKQVDENGHLFSWIKKIQWYLGFKILKVQKGIEVLIAPSRFMADTLATSYPYILHQLVYNPINFEVPFADGKRVSTDQIVRLVYLGRVQPEKGILDLLHWLVEAKKQSIHFSLDIYGLGVLADSLSATIQQLGLDAFVHYKGFIQQKTLFQSEIYQYDAFVMASNWYENAPLSIVEAAYYGLKLLVPNMGGMKELAIDCGNAYFYEWGNVDSFIKQLKILQSDDTKAHFSSSAFQAFESHHYVQTLKEIYG